MERHGTGMTEMERRGTGMTEMEHHHAGMKVPAGPLKGRGVAALGPASAMARSTRSPLVTATSTVQILLYFFHFSDFNFLSVTANADRNKDARLS